MDMLIMKTSHTPDGFCCSCDLLPGWTVSGRRDFGQFDRLVRESVDFYVRCAKADGDPLPPQLGGEWTVSYQMDAAALLNYYKGILPLSGLARLTGINQRQLAHYAAGRSRPRAGQAAKIEDALHRLGQELQGVKVLV